LKLFAFIISIYIYYYYIAVNNLYHETSFVEIIKVLFLDHILYIYIGYQLEPYVQYSRIFIESSLKVVYTRKMRFEFGTMFNKVVRPLFIHGYRTTHRMEKIGYILYHIEPRQKSLRIQVEYISYECFFFVFGQNILYILFLGLG